MTLYIQDFETEDVIFQTDDVLDVPLEGEFVRLDGKWYEVYERTFSFKHLTTIDDNKCSIFVKPCKTK